MRTVGPLVVFAHFHLTAHLLYLPTFTYSMFHKCMESKKKVVCIYLYQLCKHTQEVHLFIVQDLRSLHHVIPSNLKGSQGTNSSSPMTGVQCEENMLPSWPQRSCLFITLSHTFIAMVSLIIVMHIALLGAVECFYLKISSL
jgi:hypothetical protein